LQLNVQVGIRPAAHMLRTHPQTQHAYTDRLVLGVLPQATTAATPIAAIGLAAVAAPPPPAAKGWTHRASQRYSNEAE
tara:strand:- start:368 stop:601 length:234 start_codon:yes stop_codon:yes gene_type:complete